MEILLMNPYDGHDDRITNLIEKMSGKRVRTCPDGACPIRKPVKLISSEKINEDIQHVLDSNNVKEVMLPVLTDKDEKIIANLSKEYNWDRNPEIVINIVKIH
jgi:hypothetical protein